ncbi:MAG: hypothetical protein Kow0069_36680 [Promethearchaeota archaeon]
MSRLNGETDEVERGSGDLAWWKEVTGSFWEALMNFNIGAIDGREGTPEPASPENFGDSSEVRSSVVRIPFLGLRLPLDGLSSLLRYFAPLLLTENLNCVRVVVGDDGAVVDCQATLADPLGNFVKRVPLDIKLLGKLPADAWNVPEDFHDHVKSALSSVLGVDVGFVLVARAAAFSSLRRSLSKLPESPDLFDFAKVLATAFEEIFRGGLVTYFPRLRVCELLRSVFTFYESSALVGFAEVVRESLPEFTLLLTLALPEFYVGFGLTSKGNALWFSDSWSFPAARETLGDLAIRALKSRPKGKLNGQPKAWSVSVGAEPVADLLVELADSKFPVSAKRTRLLASKLLLLYRQLDERWSIAPYPASQRTLVRLLMRSLGFNFNVKKVEHALIPAAVHEIFGFFHGKASRVLLLYADPKEGGSSTTLSAKVFSLVLLDGFLTDVSEVPVEDLPRSALEVVPKEFNEQGYASIARRLFLETWALNSRLAPHGVIVVTRELVRRLLKNFLLDLNSSRPVRLFKLVGTLRRLRDPRHFASYPSSPLLDALQRTGGLRFIKHLLKCAVSRHEF